MNLHKKLQIRDGRYPKIFSKFISVLLQKKTVNWQDVIGFALIISLTNLFYVIYNAHEQLFAYIIITYLLSRPSPRTF